MSNGKVGLTFREMMSGGFALGETDPAQGERKGKQRGTALRMHNTILIEDLKAFFADANHVASITGHIDFTPFGENIPAPSGRFSLFSPSGDPKMKYMIYELAFQHQGQPYYLAGHKEVRENPLFDLWRDTTTLYTKLHKGSDKNAPVAGAGILSLNPMELLKMVSTFRALNGVSVEEDARTIAEFGRFFLGELWDTYVKKSS